MTRTCLQHIREVLTYSFLYQRSDDHGDDHFYQISEPLCEGTVLGLIDCANKTEIRGDAGKEGVFYCAMGKYGLYRLKVDPETKEIQFVRLTKEGKRLPYGTGCTSGTGLPHR